jgi:hypothetical protein
MMSTLHYTQGYYGNKDLASIKIADTVESTVKAIGKGQITVANVLWTINSQVADADKYDRLTEKQVREALGRLYRSKRLNMRYNGHGVYRWL